MPISKSSSLLQPRWSPGSFGLIVTCGLAAASVGAVAYRNKTIQRRLSTPPRAMRKSHKVLVGKIEGENRGENPMDPPVPFDDPYYWLRDDSRSSKEVLDYLKAENAYTEYQTRHITGFSQKLYKEFLSRIKETEEKVAYPHGDYLYYSRVVKGLSYEIECRKPRDGSGGEQIILDINEIAAGKSHCDVSMTDPSPDHSILGYGADYNGYETYTIYLKDLKTGKIFDRVIEGTTGSFCWGADNNTIYYATHDEAHRPFKVWRINLADPSSKPDLLYTENDELYIVDVAKTTSGRYIQIISESTETTEIRLIDLREGTGTQSVLVEKRSKGVRYSVNHQEDKLYIVTNADKAKNFKLMATSVNSPTKKSWKDVVAYAPTRTITRTECFKNHVVVYGREGGFTRIWILKGGKLEPIEFPEPVFAVSGGTNVEYDTAVFQFGYNSLVTPPSTYEYDLNTGSRKLLKEETVYNYDRSHYECQRLVATARDGVKVPMSMVYRKDKKKDGAQPLFLRAYGSYGASSEPNFYSDLLSLLDRGVIFVIAHIRGGGEMGREWYEDMGKYLTKKNTFNDFIDCAEHLIHNNYTSPSLLGITGRSAGGLLMGAVLNMRPDLFKVAIAGVPFVDVVNSMIDATIPLTVGEWEEWGNPNEEKFFEYIRSYSPYDNVRATNYPAILATSGLFDPRVAYWEPTKWVAKLRYLKTDKNPLLLKTDLSSGHFSASDRYKWLEERAFEYAFLLNQLGYSS